MPGTSEVLLGLLLSLAYVSQAVFGQTCAPGTYLSPTDPTACISCPSGTFNDLPNSAYPVQLTLNIALYVQGIPRGPQVFTYSRSQFQSQPKYYLDFGLGLTDISLFRLPNQGWHYGRRDPTRGYWNPPLVAQGEPSALAAASASVHYCFFCPRGYFQSSQAQTSCDLCPFNTYTDGLAPAVQCRTCTSPTRCCRPGTYIKHLYDTACTACPAGTFNAELDKTICSSCPPGTTSAPGSISPASCQKCPTGQFSPAGSTCQPCPPGTYTDSTGSPQCKTCPPGTAAQYPGSPACEPCQPGTSSNATHCYPCPPGTFSDLPALPTCKTCPSGFYSDEPGSLECKSCGKAYYSTGTACNPCSAGTANDNYQQIQCKACRPGYYQDQPGNEACIACYDGTVSSIYNSQTCTLCMAGTFSQGTGKSVCQTCPANTYADQMGLTECSPCTQWNIVSPGSSTPAPYPTTVIAEGVSPVDCSVEVHTNQFILFFFFLIENSMINTVNSRKYKLATAEALGVQPSAMYLFATPITQQGVTEALTIRAILMESTGVDVFSPLNAFLGDAAAAMSPGQGQPLQRRRRLLQAPDTQGVLYYVVHIDTANPTLPLAIAQQIQTDTFKARLDQACSDFQLANVMVVPESVQYYSPVTLDVNEVPTTYIPILTQDQPPPPTQQQPGFNSAPTHRHHKTTRDTAYLSLVISAVIILAMTWWTKEIATI